MDVNGKSTMGLEIEMLKQGFAAPVGFRIQSHVSIDASGSTIISPCCRTALALFHGSVIEAGVSSGVVGVVEFLGRQFHWGCTPCVHYCQCYEHADDIFCTSLMGLKLEALEYYRNICEHETDFRLYVVEAIMSVQPSTVNSLRSSLEKTERKQKSNRSQEFTIERFWLQSTVVYHHMVGIVDRSNNLLVSSELGDFIFPRKNCSENSSVVSIRASPWNASEHSFAPLKIMWNGLTIDCNHWNDVPVEAQSLIKLQPSPVLGYGAAVLLTGMHMGINPCAGIGIARALRAAFNDTVRIFAADDCDFSDPVLDDFAWVPELGTSTVSMGASKQKQFSVICQLLENMMRETPVNVFYIPGRDCDVETCCAAMAAIHRYSSNIDSESSSLGTASTSVNEELDEISVPALIDEGNTLEKLLYMCDRVLCPSQEAVALTEKPLIVGATQGVLGKFFKAPEYFALCQETSAGVCVKASILEAKLFAQAIGYPVLIKGQRQGACKAHSWTNLYEIMMTMVWAQRGFIQRIVYGWERCLAFAAYRGELTGCVLMTKCRYTAEGKVWSADIDPVPVELMTALERFVLDCSWTGGGELEFVEQFVDDINSDVQSPDKISRWIIDFNPRFPAWIYASSYSGCNLPALLVKHAIGRSGKGRVPAVNGTRASFVRTISEIPVLHLSHTRHPPAIRSGPAAAVKTGPNKIDRTVIRFDYLPSSNTLCKEKVAGRCNRQIECINMDLKCLLASVRSVFESSGGFPLTPRYVLSIETARRLLQRCKETLVCASNMAHGAYLSRCKAETYAATVSKSLGVRMCLSIKTQPNTELLRAAREEGYLAECIDMAEVYHSVLDGGYNFDEIVLTGPAKWWDCVSEADRTVSLVNHSKSGPKKRLHAIFADSLSDLKSIIHLITDEGSEFDTEIIGIRWTPVGNPLSRFGIDCNNVKVVKRAAEALRTLPANRYKLGFQFHYASSTIGAKQWFSQAKAFVTFCEEFSRLCNLHVTIIDFGGGFDSHYLDGDSALYNLTGLFGFVYDTFSDPLPSVQFELGKSVSEDAGAVVCKIISFRERKGDFTETSDDESSANTEETDGAIIVDTTVADVNTQAHKAIFWVSKDGDSIEFFPLSAGKLSIWGRTCMEWDALKGSFKLPLAAKEGDYLIVMGCGAYDISMQYRFGDGFSRSCNVITLADY